MYCLYHTEILLPFIPIKLVKRDEFFRSCNRYSDDAVTRRKNVTEYKQMLNSKVKFHRNEGVVIEIGRVISIYVTKFINLL